MIKKAAARKAVINRRRKKSRKKIVKTRILRGKKVRNSYFARKNSVKTRILRGKFPSKLVFCEEKIVETRILRGKFPSKVSWCLCWETKACYCFAQILEWCYSNFWQFFCATNSLPTTGTPPVPGVSYWYELTYVHTWSLSGTRYMISLTRTRSRTHLCMYLCAW